MTTKPRTSKGSGAKQRGGKRPNSGNKAKDGATMATTDQVCVRIWKRQRKDFRALGGSEWLRRMIDEETQDNATVSRPREAACDEAPADPRSA